MNDNETGALASRLHTEVERLLLARGYEKTRHREDPGDWGSLYTVYEKPEWLVRLIWDGREGGLTLRIYRRRNWGGKLVRALIGGTAGDEKLVKEAVVGRVELAERSERELTDRLLEALVEAPGPK